MESLTVFIVSLRFKYSPAFIFFFFFFIYSKEGIIVDPVYSGKLFDTLLDPESGLVLGKQPLVILGGFGIGSLSMLQR